MGNSPETNLSKFPSSHMPGSCSTAGERGTGSREYSVWKFPFAQASEHEVDLAEDPFTLKPLYGEVRPAETWRSANRSHGKLSEG